MAFRDDSEEIECKIIESYGIFSRGIKYWNKEVNLVSWNGRPAKLDIRNWQMDHEKCGKGIAITREEAEELVKLLSEILKAKPGSAEKERTQNSKKARSFGKSGTFGKTEASGESDRYRTAKKPGNSGRSGAYKKQAKKTPHVPMSLEPLYRELKLFFGAGPEECKTARNTLLKKYHPDMYAGNTVFATRKTIKIKEAYEKIIEWWNSVL